LFNVSLMHVKVLARGPASAMFYCGSPLSGGFDMGADNNRITSGAGQTDHAVPMNADDRAAFAQSAVAYSASMQTKQQDKKKNFLSKNINMPNTLELGMKEAFKAAFRGHDANLTKNLSSVGKGFNALRMVPFAGILPTMAIDGRQKYIQKLDGREKNAKALGDAASGLLKMKSPTQQDIQHVKDMQSKVEKENTKSNLFRYVMRPMRVAALAVSHPVTLPVLAAAAAAGGLKRLVPQSRAQVDRYPEVDNNHPEKQPLLKT
jgi:hypothetical protein